MKKNSFFSSLPFKLIVALALGIVIGLILNAADGAPEPADSVSSVTEIS